MAAIDFPNGPTLNQEFTSNGRTWVYDGAKWLAKGTTAVAGPRGETGLTGATGATGPSGVIAVTAPIVNGGTSTSASLSIQSSPSFAGNIKIPEQTYFSAQNGSSAVAAGNDIIFTTVNKNIGNAYNSANGRFTAPIAGVYDFRFWNLFNNAGAGEYRVAFYKNGAGLEGARWIFQKAANTWYTGHCNGMFYLAANDYVTVRYEQGTGVMYTDANYTGFQGRFLG